MGPTLGSLIAVLFGSSGDHGELLRTDADVEAAARLGPGTRHPTDLSFSHDGRRTLVTIGEVVELRPTTGAMSPFLQASNAAGALELSTAAAFSGVGVDRQDADAVSAAFDPRGGIVTIHRDGSVRIGGERVHELERPRRMRISREGLIAIVTEHDGGSKVHLLDAEGHPVAVLEGGLPVGGVAWSPSGGDLVYRTARGLSIHDAVGRRIEELPLSDGAPRHTISGCVGWSARGLFGLHESVLVHLPRTGGRRTFEPASFPVSFAVMHEGRYLALVSSEAKLALVDLETPEHTRVPWTTYLVPWSPIAFTPSDDALIWADYLGRVVAVPFGEVEVDAAGRAIDPEASLLERCHQRALASPGIDELRGMVEEIQRTTFRRSLSSQAALLRSGLETRLKARLQEASKNAMFAAPTPSGFSVGDRARHPKFGEGAVTAVEGAGNTAKITVAFADGRRSLRASFLTRA